MPRGSSSSQLKEKRKKVDKNKLTKADLLIRKLRKVNRRGKVVGQKNKMSTFKAQSSYDIAKQQSNSKTGMSNLGSNYKKQEEKFSKKATEDSAKRNKAKYPLMGTYKNKDGKSVADEKKNKLKVKKGKSSIEQKNRDRFGDPHVDKLKQKQADFKKMKKKQMSKAEFIKKYPNSQTAKKAKGL